MTSHFTPSICVAVLLLSPLTGDDSSDEPTALKTMGPVAQAPLQVGMWTPMAIETPPWIFPQYRIKWATARAADKLTAEEYAQRFVEEFRKRANDYEPVWLQTHAWFGSYKQKIWDRENLFCHEEDATPQGTPGIWPEIGKEIWIDRQDRFLTHLKKNGVRVDVWMLDNETRYGRYGANFQQQEVFRNMVLDPRWKSRELAGLGITGSRLLDPAQLDDKESWVRKHRQNPQILVDSLVAHDHVWVLGYFVRSGVLNEVFYKTLRRHYPHVLANEFGAIARPLHWRADDPLGEGRLERADIWKRLGTEVGNRVHEVPGVGNTCAPVMYGPGKRRKQKLRGPDPVAWHLNRVDTLITRYGEPDKVVPWIGLPPELPGEAHETNRPQFSAKEYERLIVGLAARGIRRMGLFNPKGFSDERALACVDVLKMAYRVAEERLNRLESQRGTNIGG